MSWLTNIPPKIRALVSKPDVPENLWRQCSACEQMIFHRELDANLRVCPGCGHHMRLPAEMRLKTIFDEGSWQRLELPGSVNDPLKFRDRKRYSDRLKDTRSATGENDAIMAAEGKIGGMGAVAAVFNFAFMGGSMGIGVGEGILVSARRAVKKGVPFLIFPSSGGARMQEGIMSLMQMPRSTIAVQEVREAGLPYIVVLTDPTTGGVSASFAMLGDISIAEPGAMIGFAGARVIEDTIREKLPDGFQRAEYLYDHGMIDMVVKRHDLKETLIRIIDLLVNRKSSSVPDEIPLDLTQLAPPGAAETGPAE